MRYSTAVQSVGAVSLQQSLTKRHYVNLSLDEVVDVLADVLRDMDAAQDYQDELVGP